MTRESTVMTTISTEELSHMYVKLNEQRAAIGMLERARNYWHAKAAGQVSTTMQRRIVLMHDTPRIVCLCGSTRFLGAYQTANLDETLKGNIVLTIGTDVRSDTEIWADCSPEELTRIKRQLDELHKRKIDVADEVLVLNVGGYIGESTKSEVEYAKAMLKPIRYLEPELGAAAGS